MNHMWGAAVAFVEKVLLRNRAFRFKAARTLLATMLVWPRKRRLGPPRLPDELWHMVAVEFVLPMCAPNIAISE